MIKPIRKRAQVHPISTYDLEWRQEETPDGRIKKLAVRLAGAYDEKGYRAYPDCAAFLRGELVPGNSGRRYYAHFGGGADMVFLLRELAKLPDDYVVTGVFSGSAAIVVRVVRGACEWLFLDSYWTLRVPLAAIGEWLGEKKGDLKNFNDAPIWELKIYNEQDCRILYLAMQRVQNAILEVGGELGITIASTAMKTFLRKYLKRPIKNSEYLDAIARNAYVASRVEVIRPECERANYFDINSSFPYSFTFPCPGSQLTGGWSRKALPGSDKTLWIADVDLRVPDDCYLPAVPFRSKGRVFFPKGRFRASITSEDFKAGGFEIDRVHECTSFEDRDDLRAFAEEFYRLRQLGGFEGKVYKICLNGLYGKFAERDEKTVLLVRPGTRDVFNQTMIAPGIVIQAEQKKVPHSHVPMSAMITARSRRLLLEGLRDAATRGKVYYADTDSIVCDAELETSPALGGWKKEYTIERGRFVSQKLYAMGFSDETAMAMATEKKKDWGCLSEVERDQFRRVVKAKGFSRVVGFEGEVLLTRKPGEEGHQTDSKPMTYGEFIRLSEGARVYVERMARIRELVARDGADYSPRSMIVTKGLNRKTDKNGMPQVRPKRKPLANGDSEPWNARELVDWVRNKKTGALEQFERREELEDA